MNKIKRKSRQVQQRRQLRNHKRSVLIISAVIIMLTVVVSVNAMTLRAKEKSFKAQEIELQQRIEEEQTRAEEIDELEQYVGTDEYVEEVAREKLGLVYRNEIIFKAK